MTETSRHAPACCDIPPESYLNFIIVLYIVDLYIPFTWMEQWSAASWSSSPPAVPYGRLKGSQKMPMLSPCIFCLPWPFQPAQESYFEMVPLVVQAFLFLILASLHDFHQRCHWLTSSMHCCHWLFATWLWSFGICFSDVPLLGFHLGVS